MKTIATITVRTGSKRLPLKALRLICGKTMIEHIIERIGLAKSLDEIVLCTSELPEDDMLIDIAEKCNIGSFRGNAVDVVDRLTNAAIAFNADLVISATGDNPLIDYEHIDKLVGFHREDRTLDYSYTVGLPLGTNIHAVTTNALKRLCNIKKVADTEIWFDYFEKSQMFKTQFYYVNEELYHPEIRLTVDTKEDLNLIREIFERLHSHSSLIEVIELLHNYPDLLDMNKSVIQQSPPVSIIEDINRMVV